MILAFSTIPAGLCAFLTYHVFKIPYVVWLRGGDVPGFMPQSLGTHHRLLQPLIHAIWKNSKAVLANGPYLRNLARRSLPGLDVIDIPNGIEPIHCGKRVPPPPLRCVFASRIVREQKGIEELPVLWAKIRHRFSHLSPQLEILGDGPALSDLKMKMKGKEISFPGWLPREELIRRLQQAHLSIHLSRYEGISNSALEALSAGCILLVNHAPCNEWLKEAPGVFIHVDAIHIEDFNRLSMENHVFALDYDWGVSARALKRVLDFL
jgi:hypothetical protein